MSRSAVVFCACEIIYLPSVVFFVVRDVREFYSRCIKDKLAQWKEGHAVIGILQRTVLARWYFQTLG